MVGKTDLGVSEKPEEPDKKSSEPNKEDVKVVFGRDVVEGKDLGLLLNKDIKTEADLDEVVKEGYVPKIVAAMMNFALNKKASDIHIEPQAKILRIRFRIDGVLTDAVKLPIALHPPIISRVKIISKLKIDESRIPQDGRFAVSLMGKEVDVRVSSLPTVHGEKIVLRILDKNQKILSLEDLGMQGTAFDKTLEAIKKPWGIILSTGPTGSGKSTTLTAILTRLNGPGVNIITLEDPVEYETPGANQCQVKPDIGFTFASGLRSVLRQDPNIIMVGEIRDGETAGMATQAALTGHLVLSTLHTNDTAGSLPRLTDMGIEPFLITSSMNLVIAQRLVRLICPDCKEEVKLPQKLIEEIKVEIDKIPANNTKDRQLVPQELKFYYGRGCNKCSNGYKGRIGLFEVMMMTPEIEELAIGKKSANEIKVSAIKTGMITMKQDGIIKALQGLTTIDEVFQATIEK
jgi:type IV pilus assembly protein PilB